MKRIKDAMRHCYWALRYGDWHCGCEQYTNKPQFGFFYGYYDGHHACLHLGPLWLGVEY